MASSTNLFDELLRQGLLITAALVLPTAVCLGAAFPLALVDRRRRIDTTVAGRFGIVYAVNTIGAVLGIAGRGLRLHPAVRAAAHAAAWSAAA